MKSNVKTSLGIDISDGMINMVMLKRCRAGIKLVRFAKGTVPDGAVQNGNIADPGALAKAIKKLQRKNRLNTTDVVMSLAADPTLMQIVKMPKNIPGNMTQFVKNEIKNYALLPSGQIALDYCRIQSNANENQKRLFVVAADRQNLVDVISEFDRKCLNITDIEPPLIGLLRAAFDKNSESDRNIVFALIQRETTAVCLLKNNSLDFIRFKKNESDLCSSYPLRSEKFQNCLAEELNSLIQFYEIEASGLPQKFEVNIAANLPEDELADFARLKAIESENVTLNILPLEDTCGKIVTKDMNQGNKPSLVATGLAMKLLDTSNASLNINMLPDKITQNRIAKKQLLIAANAAAMVFVLLIFGIMFLTSKEKQLSQKLSGQKTQKPYDNTQSLFNECEILDRKITDANTNLSAIEICLKEYRFIDWGQALGDIKQKIPDTVQITSIEALADSDILIEGYALSHDSLRLFVDMLKSSKNINSSSLIETEKSNKENEALKYVIVCSLKK